MGLSKLNSSKKSNLTNDLFDQVNSSKFTTSSSTMNVSKNHSSARLNHLSELRTPTGSSSFSNFNLLGHSTLLAANNSGLPLSKSKLNNLKREEGLEGLPEERKLVDEKDFENADSCFSCQKELKKNFGKLTGKGRHHCRRCGRTVCKRCWQNSMRISKSDKQAHNVCD